MDAKLVLTHLIRAGRDALHMENVLNELGYHGTPYFNLHGEISDAIYEMIGENTETFDQSETYAAMHDIYTTDEICAEQLAERTQENWTAIPETARGAITETAEELGISFDNMVSLILSEWAMRQVRIANMIK